MNASPNMGGIPSSTIWAVPQPDILPNLKHYLTSLILFSDGWEGAEDDSREVEDEVVEGVEVVSDGAQLRVHQLALHLVARVGRPAVPERSKWSTI